MKTRFLLAVLVAIVAAILLPDKARAAAWEDFAKPYITNLASMSKGGNTARGLNPDPHFITISPPDWYDSEQAAVSGFSWGTAPDRSAVGGAFRGYSDGSPWAFGIAAEAISSPTSTAHVIGAELDVVSRNANSAGSAKWGLDVILFNRMTGAAGALESPLGGNRFNEGSRGIVIESLPRSAAGEYSGWQTGIYFGTTALDRTVDKPYAAAVDVSDVTSQGSASWYLVVFKCAAMRCGIKATANGLEVWENIDVAPHLARTL